jgi:hypothetical protein
MNEVVKDLMPCDVASERFAKVTDVNPPTARPSVFFLYIYRIA